MSLVRFNNSVIPTVFDHFFNDESWANQLSQRNAGYGYMPATNIKEDENSYTVELAAPGYTKEDFSIKLDNDVLTIGTEKNDETTSEEMGYTRQEFNYQSFQRSFRLPENRVDHENVAAEYLNGILYITLPKREELKPKPAKQISIN